MVPVVIQGNEMKCNKNVSFFLAYKLIIRGGRLWLYPTYIGQYIKISKKNF